jgi:hypothetical protein
MTKENKIESDDDFEYPAWQECTWRRVPCNKPDCPMCGRIQRQRQKHIDQGEDPDDIEYVMADVKETFKETFELLKKNTKDLNIDFENLDEDCVSEPEPEEYLIYNNLMEWRRKVYDLANQARSMKAWWVDTDPGKDLTWYANLLPSKVYRLLIDLWEIKNQDQDVKFDYDYTKYVIRECLKSIYQAFEQLAVFDTDKKQPFTNLQKQLKSLEKEILLI